MASFLGSRSAWTSKRLLVKAGHDFSRRQFGRASRKAATSTLFWCEKVVFPEAVSAGSVEVREGEIIACKKGQILADAKRYADQAGVELLDLGGESCLSPGLVDVHVHISALGRNWEGYETATKAAAAGGITTIIGMPLNSLPPTTSPENFLLEKQEASKFPLFVDVGLWGGVVPGNCNPDDLNRLLESGVLGLKAFLSPLPPAAGYEAVSPSQLLEAAKICGQHGKPILVHAELMTESELQTQLQDAYAGVDSRSYQAHLQSRPPEWEQAAVAAVCEAATHCHMHIVHLSDAGCLDMIRATKEDPTKTLSVETCPHDLLLDSSQIDDGNTRVKCFPPIRDVANREKLFGGLRDGLIDIVASDHSPCEPFMRCHDTGNMKEAWGGLTGLQYQLPATWTEASNRGFSLLDIANWWSRNPFALAKLDDRKGSIEVGKQADFCWWNPDYEGQPSDYSLEYHRWTGDSYFASNASLQGRVLGTWVAGVKVYDGEADQHQDSGGEFLESC